MLLIANKLRLAVLLIGAVLLSGCAGVRLVDTQVNSFVPQAIAPDASYQFERLPSQMADPVNQAKLEKLAEQALTKVGLRRQNNAPLLVQVSAVQRQENAFYQNGMGIGWGLGWVFGHGAISIGNRGMLFPGLESRTAYWRQVSLIMRNASGVVVFESHASHEGVWSDSEVVLAAMLDAALQGFPAPPAGVRRVDIEIPR